MATTISAVLAALRTTTTFNNSAAWNSIRVPPLTAGQHTNAMVVLNAGTVATEADALALVAQSAMVSSSTPASITCTSASPGVITWTTHGLAIGQSFMLIAGTAPTGLTLYTPYFIITAGFGASSFQFSLTLGGAAINTSSTGSAITAIPIGGSFPQASEKQLWDLMVAARPDAG